MHSHQTKGNGGRRRRQCVETHLQVERVEPRLGDRCWGWGGGGRSLCLCVLRALVSVSVDRALKRKGHEGEKRQARKFQDQGMGNLA